jgi:hypothetical protein
MKDSQDPNLIPVKCRLFVKYFKIALIFKKLRLSLGIFPNLRELSQL